MKKIFGIALMMAVIAGGITMNAQTPATPKTEKTEQCDKQRKCNGKEAAGKKKDGAHKHHNKGQRPDLFDGITLTEEQKTQLDALKAEMKAQRKAGKDNNTKPTKEEREARRAEHDAKVKAILTPEQWAVYQKNLDDMKAKRQKKNA